MDSNYISWIYTFAYQLWHATYAKCSILYFYAYTSSLDCFRTILKQLSKYDIVCISKYAKYTTLHILKLVISLCVTSLYDLNIFVTIFVDKLAFEKQRYGFMNEKYHENGYFPVRNYVQNVTW